MLPWTNFAPEAQLPRHRIPRQLHKVNAIPDLLQHRGKSFWTRFHGRHFCQHDLADSVTNSKYRPPKWSSSGWIWKWPGLQIHHKRKWQKSAKIEAKKLWEHLEFSIYLQFWLSAVPFVNLLMLLHFAILFFGEIFQFRTRNWLIMRYIWFLFFSLI